MRELGQLWTHPLQGEMSRAVFLLTESSHSSCPLESRINPPHRRTPLLGLPSVAFPGAVLGVAPAGRLMMALAEDKQEPEPEEGRSGPAAGLTGEPPAPSWTLLALAKQCPPHSTHHLP